MYLYGCKGYAYNYFVNKLNLPRKYIKLLKEHMPTDSSGQLEKLSYSPLPNTPDKNIYLCKVLNNKPNPVLTFIIHNQTIYLSWAKQPCKTANRWNIVDCKKSRKKCDSMNIKKIHVSNLFSKLKRLTVAPSFKLLHELFGYDKSYLYPGNDINKIINNFKDAKLVVYSLV